MLTKIHRKIIIIKSLIVVDIFVQFHFKNMRVHKTIKTIEIIDATLIKNRLSDLSL